jgi:transcriptional regulator
MVRLSETSSIPGEEAVEDRFATAAPIAPTERDVGPSRGTERCHQRRTSRRIVEVIEAPCVLGDRELFEVRVSVQTYDRVLRSESGVRRLRAVRVNPRSSLGYPSPTKELDTHALTQVFHSSSMGKKGSERQDLLPGTLDMLILKTLSRQVMHGYGIAEHIRQVSADVLSVEEGSLYPALQRLQLQGLIASEWGQSANNRRARYYRLTPAGRRQLGETESNFSRLMEAIARVMKPA